eukprot:gnl/TRDRNA2_/TRDRNA2_129410_c0_seq2.p1 gnl/TRDRNA2_/TRDRNA2_129410_c0~~gnl/TRDRNA2_/TRDRNA2_129410_c0_seq2.p1  ORF type:complete len:233 (-),score=43.92 gnl/TRDRNA2_/TRDRNA2_129410_c0_seq2:19-717(-)
MATKAQRMSIIEHLLRIVLTNEVEDDPEGAESSRRFGILADWAAVLDNDHTELIDTVCHCTDLDEILGEKREPGLHSKVLKPLLTQLDDILPADVRIILQVSPPEECDQWKLQLSCSLLELYGQTLGEAAQLVPQDKVQPLVAALVTGYIDLMKRSAGQLSQARGCSGEDRIQDALAAETIAVAEAKAAEERARALSGLAAIKNRRRRELESELYWFPPLRWWRRWNRKEPI